MRQRWPGLAIALTALLLAIPVTARADGDPASDVLLGQNVYYPYTPQVTNALQGKLNAETAAAAKAHFPIKVALIASPIDLGVIPELFGKPALYAKYLEPEISFNYQAQPLLVVMKAGYGIQGMKPAARTALATLRRPVGGSSDDLAQAALTAVASLAKAEGHPLTSSSGGATSATSAPSNVALIIVLAFAAILIAGALLVLRHRHAAARHG